MLVWKLCNHIAESSLQEWKDLAKLELGNQVSPAREKTYLFAREALRLALLELNIEASPKDLSVKNFHSLLRWPELTISLSHSQSMGAAIVAKKSQSKSIGIDIEPVDREIKPSIAERIKNPLDIETLGLEAWCLKEAIYKCLMNSERFDHPFGFSQIQIKKNTWIHPTSLIQGKWDLNTQSNHLVATAQLD
jgi:4'-phosphopantetheinyl transferase EntD